MKKIIYSILILAGILTGCSDGFLTTSDPNQVTDDNYWSSENDVLYAIYGCYDVLQRDPLYGGGPYNPGFRDHDCLSDNSYNAWGWNGLLYIADGSITSDQSILLNYWSANYAGIARTNQLIANVSSVESLSEEKANSYLGEARFLRALFYFNLVNAFGDVPLILEPQSINDANVAKTTKADIYTEIIKDLKFATENVNTSDFGRVTKGAAWGLLTRVYLYDKQYPLAADAAKEVMNLGYGLYGDYTTLFTTEAEQSSEIVFSVLFESLMEGEGEKFSGTWAKVAQTHDQPMPNLVNDYYCTDGLPIYESSLYNPNNKTENRDLRLDVSVLFPGEVWLEGKAGLEKSRTKTGYALQKYVRHTTEYIEDGPQDFYLIRYADILLMRAEALIESGETGQEVYDLIDQVRQRALMPKIEDVEGTGLSQDQLRTILRHERRVELAFEGLRYYDLIRWGELEQARETAGEDVLTAMYNPVYEGEKSLYWPLPQTEVDNNTLLEQNPLWK